MARPSKTAVAAAIGGGLVNVAVILSLYTRAGYPRLDSVSGIGVLAITGFALGFIAILATAHTRLLTPTIGFLAVLVGTMYLELASPLPEWGKLDGHIIVEGPTHISSYANTWYVWLALVVFVGVIEFGIRRGYGISNKRLQHLPNLPLSRSTTGWIVAGVAGCVGLATMLLVIRSGIRPTAAALIVFVVAAAVTAIPVAALLVNGILLPTVLFVIFVPFTLSMEVFVTTDSPVHILLFGPYTIVLVVAWVLETIARSRFSGWDGGQFTATPSERDHL